MLPHLAHQNDLGWMHVTPNHLDVPAVKTTYGPALHWVQTVSVKNGPMKLRGKNWN